MDEYNGKRTVSGFGVSRRGSGLAFRDTSNHEVQSVQYCNRLGCSTRLDSIKGSQNGSSDRTKYPRPSFRSVSGKAIASNSSKTYSGVSNPQKSHQEPRKLYSHREAVPAEAIGKQGETEASESIPSTSRIQTGLEPDDTKSGVVKGLSADAPEKVRSYSVTSNTKPRKKIHQQSGLGSQDNSVGSSIRHSILSRKTSQVAKPAPFGQGTNSSRYCLRRSGCSSVSDVPPSGCSSSHSSPGSRTNVVKKRCADGESYAAKGKNTSGSSTVGSSGTERNSLSIPSLSLSERPSSQQVSSRAKNWPPRRDGVASVRTQRTLRGETRGKLSEHGNGNSSSLPEPIVVSPPLPQTKMPTCSTSSSLSRQFPAQLPSVRRSSNGQPVGSSENVCTRQIAHTEDGIAQPFHGISMDQDGFGQFNMDGIAEVLLALERIEQDEELTYEQLLILETNLFLGGLSFLDQHRDMRLDIDNMSYEELLALEEKMGTVSTALTEQALLKCLERSFYTPAPPDTGCMGCGDDDVKCSICQEEYFEGDEVGKLGCEHGYHVGCIQQWLRQKNWCPICKAPAAAS